MRGRDGVVGRELLKEALWDDPEFRWFAWVEVEGVEPGNPAEGGARSNVGEVEFCWFLVKTAPARFSGAFSLGADCSAPVALETRGVEFEFLGPVILETPKLEPLVLPPLNTDVAVVGSKDPAAGTADSAPNFASSVPTLYTRSLVP